MTPIISKTDLAALLGRSLTAVEDTNYQLYLDIAEERVLDILCMQELPDPIPAELKLLIARMFGTMSAEQETNSNAGVSSKRVEDFSITFGSSTDMMTNFVEQNRLMIEKYSQCRARIRTGKSYCGNCIQCI